MFIIKFQDHNGNITYLGKNDMMTRDIETAFSWSHDNMYPKRSTAQRVATRWQNEAVAERANAHRILCQSTDAEAIKDAQKTLRNTDVYFSVQRAAL